MQKNNKISIYGVVYFVVASLLLGVTLFPSYASATSVLIPESMPVTVIAFDRPGEPPNDIVVCPGNDPSNLKAGFTSRLIPCIRNSIFYTTANLLDPLTKYFSGATTAVLTLAIVVWGLMVTTGRVSSISQDGFVLAVKIGAVVMFANNFAGFYPKLLDSMESVLTMMVAPLVKGDFIWRETTATYSTFCKIGSFGASQSIMTLWNILDCYLDLFIGGIFSKESLSWGLAGFVVATLVSTQFGLFIGLAGIFMLLTAVFTIGRCIYIFITSYIAFSFMVITSFMFIPCILFKSTKRYFDGWLSLTISFLMQPIFLLGYMAMFLVAFNSTIFHGNQSLYYAIAGQASQEPNFQLGKWIETSGGYKQETFGKDHMKVDPKGAAAEIGYTQLVPALTAVEGTPGARQDNTPYGKGAPNNSGFLAGINFFETGKIVNVVQWEILAKNAFPDQYWEAHDRDAGVYDTEDKIFLKTFYNDYKIAVFLSFLMATLFMYLFFSLLSYIPYIGNGAMSNGIGIPIGAGGLSLPGSKLLAAAR